MDGVNGSFKNQHFDRVWSSFETFFDNFEQGLLREIKKTDVYFYTLKVVTQTKFEACVNAIFNFWVNFSNIVDSHYVSSSQSLMKGFFQKSKIAYT